MAAPVTAVFAAAGSGERLGAGGPKAFVPLAGRPMIEWSIEAFREVEPVGTIVVACPPGHRNEEALGGSVPGRDGAGLVVVDGGQTRAESVANALGVVETDLVAIHDAARPLITPALIEGAIETLLADEGASGVVVATPVTDTIKQVRGQGPSAGAAQAGSADRVTSFPPYGVDKASLDVEGTLDRTRLWAAQTPQVFRTAALRDAMVAADSASAATDEAMLIEAAGGRVLIHPSTPENLKVTTPIDLKLAELLLAAGAS